MLVTVVQVGVRSATTKQLAAGCWTRPVVHHIYPQVCKIIYYTRILQFERTFDEHNENKNTR